MGKSRVELKPVKSCTVITVPLDWDEYTRISKDYSSVLIVKSVHGRGLRTPIQVDISWIRGRRDLDIFNYAVCALQSRIPRLIPWAFSRKSLRELIKYLRVSRSSSHSTLVNYINTLHDFEEYCGIELDEIIDRARGSPDGSGREWLVELIDEYRAELVARGLSRQSVASKLSMVRTWLKLNKISPPVLPPARIVPRYRIRAPTPDEVWRLMEVADLRGKVIVSILATSGMRVSTLARLKYYHVKADLERGITPVHIHIESELNKGAYCSYDTFINHEAATYLRLYLEGRRRGSVSGKIPPEVITDDSPLIRDGHSRVPRPITPSRISQIVRGLFVSAGLVEGSTGGRRELCTHSLRKYFRTQLTSAGVPVDLVEYMMGHRVSTYFDVSSLGIEYLRKVYIRSGISIRPKTKVSRIEILKEIVRSLGLDPEKVLVKDALEECHRTELYRRDEEEEVELLRKTIRKLIMEITLKSRVE